MQKIESNKKTIIDKALKLNKQYEIFEFAIQSNLFDDKEINFLKKHHDIISEKKWITIDENSANEYFGTLPINLTKLFKNIKKKFTKDVDYHDISTHILTLKYCSFKDFLTFLNNSTSREIHRLFEMSELIITTHYEYTLQRKIKDLEIYLRTIEGQLTQQEQQCLELKKQTEQLLKDLVDSKAKEARPWIITRLIRWMLGLVFCRKPKDNQLQPQ